jgi:heme/copper-type cytochrome/quinol oxidase subunit 2
MTFDDGILALGQSTEPYPLGNVLGAGQNTSQRSTNWSLLIGAIWALAVEIFLAVIGLAIYWAWMHYE